MHFDIEAVTVCVGMSNVLEKTVGNKKHFKDWVIVTDPMDSSTQKLCEENDIRCVCSERSGVPKTFRKGMLINDGLKELGRKAWLLQIDCDILLPNDFSETLAKTQLKEDNIYGSKREFVIENQTDELIEEAAQKDKRWGIYILGYFQLFHSNRENTYPESSIDCSHDDLEFQQRWHDSQRTYLPLQVKHLGLPFNKESWAGKKIDLIRMI